MTRFRFVTPRNVLLLLLPGLYVSDMLYGLVNHFNLDLPMTPGTMIRGGVFIAALVVIVIRADLVSAVPGFILLLLFCLPVPGMLTSVIAYPSPGTLAFELGVFVKVMFGPTLLVLFGIVIRVWRLPADTIVRYIEAAFYFLGVSLLVMKLLGVGADTYGDYSSGSKGIFVPQNDISLALGLGLVAASYSLVTRFGYFRLGLLLLAAVGFIGIGTRTSLILTLSVPVATAVIVIFSAGDRQLHLNKLKLLFVLIPVLTVGVSTLGYVTYKELTQYQYQVNKYKRLASGEHPRLPLLEAGYLQLRDRGPAEIFWGEGATRYRRGVYQHWHKELDRGSRQVEVDWMDLYGQYGLIFTALLHFSLLLLILAALVRWLSGGNPLYGAVFLALTVYLLHSTLAGHALVSPITSSLAAAFAALLLTAGREEQAGELQAGGAPGG